MKRLTLCLLTLLLLLGGCTAAKKQDKLPDDAYAHADHHVAQTRKEQNFYLESVDKGELTAVYLSYKEADGCITQLCELDVDPYHMPELFCQGSAFYYICHTQAMGGEIESDGYLYSVGFDGEKKLLKAEDAVDLGYIVRTDENYVYCAINDAQAYVRSDLGLTGWTECSREEALGSEG